MAMKKEYKYIVIGQEFEYEMMHNNPVYRVRNLRSGDGIGFIHWSIPWRQFVFCPYAATIYSRGCMLDIADFLQDAMAEKAANKSK